MQTMTDTNFSALAQASARPARPSIHTTTPPTIYRDLVLHNSAPFTQPELFASDDSDRVAPLLQIGLAALVLPAVAYSLTTIWTAVTNGSLQAAMHAILP